MDIDSRVHHVAFHRARLLVSAHSEEAVQEEQMRRARAQQHGA